MTEDELITLLYRLEKLMYGHNYEVKYGIDIFENCFTIENFKTILKNKYPDSKPESVMPIEINRSDFWEEIDFGLNYRGDNSAGLKLNESQLAKLNDLQQMYKEFIKQSIDIKTRIYSYPDEKGIPGYPVFWDYRFILQTDNGVCLFIYASASD